MGVTTVRPFAKFGVQSHSSGAEALQLLRACGVDFLTATFWPCELRYCAQAAVCLEGGLPVLCYQSVDAASRAHMCAVA